jgi:hypothetical protein
MDFVTGELLQGPHAPQVPHEANQEDAVVPHRNPGHIATAFDGSDLGEVLAGFLNVVGLSRQEAHHNDGWFHT